MIAAQHMSLFQRRAPSSLTSEAPHHCAKKATQDDRLYENTGMPVANRFPIVEVLKVFGSMTTWLLEVHDPHFAGF